MSRLVSLIAASALLTSCSSAPSVTTSTAIATATPTVIATPKPTASAQASQESLVYPVTSTTRKWDTCVNAQPTDPGEPECRDWDACAGPASDERPGLDRLVRQMTGSEVRATWSPDGSQVAYVQTPLAI